MIYNIMGFSEEVSVLMSSGNYKSIKNVVQGDFVMNKAGKVVRVNKNYKQLGQNCVSFKRAGDNTTLYATPDQRFACYYENTTGGMGHSYLTCSQISTRSGKFETGANMFSTSNNISMNNYSATLVSKDVYSLDVSDSSKSFIINTVIAIEDTRI